MHTKLYPWQYSAWEALMSVRQQMPHAILLHGAAGTGKTYFASILAQALLCNEPLADGQPCRRCDSCGWFVQYSHPDFRRLRPEILEDEEGDGGDSAVEAEASSAAKPKALSKEIRIDQVRSLAAFMNLSTHRNGKRVVLLYPAESLNPISANALLKTLEEPQAETVMILVTSRIDRLLPTILSRCRKLPMPLPTRAESQAWLEAQQVTNAASWLDEQGGAPLSALAQSQAGGRVEFDLFLTQIAHPSRENALSIADKFQKTPLPELVAWLQRWLYDVFRYKLSGTIRYYPRHQRQLTALAGRARTEALMTGLQSMGQRRTVADHPLSAKLFIEDMMLDYVQIFD
ncbi:MAG: DNA polymerase III subunit delta' [Burkholderiaceae bacterium]